MGRRRRNAYIFAPERQTHHLRNFMIWCLCIFGLIFLIFFTLNLVSNNQAAYVTQRVTVEELTSDLENFTILQLSDLNGADIGRDESAIRSVLNTRNVSCVVLCGDMVGKSGDPSNVLTILDALAADVPVYFIAGDSDPAPLATYAHDSISPYSAWAEALTDHGAVYLDEPIAITRKKSTLWLVPEYLYSLDLDSMEKAYAAQQEKLRAPGVILTPDEAAQLRVAEYQLDKLASIRQSIALMKDADIQVVVSHTPLTQEYVQNQLAWNDKQTVFSYHNASLILSAHYAAGQWRLPGLGALYNPDLGWWPADEDLMGLNYVGGIPQYISPGLGPSDFYAWMPGRFLNEPTLTCVQLTSKVT